MLDIKENKLYPALRILDQIQKVHLRKGVAGDGPLFRYSFIYNIFISVLLYFLFELIYLFIYLFKNRVLDAHVPKLRTKIKKQVLEEFNDWLVLVRQKCEQLGSLAMRRIFYNF